MKSPDILAQLLTLAARQQREASIVLWQPPIDLRIETSSNFEGMHPDANDELRRFGKLRETLIGVPPLARWPDCS